MIITYVKKLYLCLTIVYSMNVLVYKTVMTRPYSWVGAVLVAIMANVMATRAFLINWDMAYDVLTAFAIWCTSTLAVEYFHRKTDGRGLTNPVIPLLSIALLLAMFAYKNAAALIFLPILIAADVMYSMKIRNLLISRFSFMLRGILEVCTFLVVAFFHNSYDVFGFLTVLLVIFMLTNSRNLIGDIRDVKFDSYTFPKRYGTGISYAVSVAFIIVSFLLLPDILIMLPALLFIAAIPLSRNAYTLHRLFVLATTFFYMNYILYLLGQSLVFSNILFIAVLLNFSYPSVPRKSNPRQEGIYSYQK